MLYIIYIDHLQILTYVTKYPKAYHFDYGNHMTFLR